MCSGSSLAHRDCEACRLDDLAGLGHRPMLGRAGAKWPGTCVSTGDVRRGALVVGTGSSAVGLLGAGLIIGKLDKRMLRFADVEGSVVVFAPQGAGRASVWWCRTCSPIAVRSSAPIPKARTMRSPVGRGRGSGRSIASMSAIPTGPSVQPDGCDLSGDLLRAVDECRPVGGNRRCPRMRGTRTATGGIAR